MFNNAIDHGRQLEFEQSDSVLRYTKPSRTARYIPDFTLPNGVLVETKGRLTSEDRTKMLLVKSANPEADIRFLFQRAGRHITKSKNSLTYEQWAEKHGFRWSIGDNIPEEWWYE